MSRAKSQSLFVVEASGLAVRAAVFGAGDAAPKCVETSTNADVSAALAEIVGRLRTRGVALPRTALLSTPEAVGAVLELPVNPASRLPFARMTEMVAWELEPLFAEQALRPRIGTILVGRGYLTVEQLGKILSEHGCFGTGLDSPAEPTRVGDLAVQGAYLTQAQLSECLDLQHKLGERPTGELVCGWSPQDAVSEHLWRWQVCAISRGRRDALHRTFVACGLSLQAIFPLSSTGGALRSGEQDYSFLEVHPSLVGGVRVVKGRTHAFRTRTINCPCTVAALCAELLPRDNTPAWLGGTLPVEKLEVLARDVARASGQSCHVQPPSFKTTEHPGWDLTGLAGAAKAFSTGDEHSPAFVPATEPAPPWIERGGFWFATAAAVLILVAAGFQWTAAMKRRELNDLADEQERIQNAIARNLAEKAALETKRTELKDLEARVAGSRRTHQFLGETLPKRDALLSDMLAALRESVNEDLILDQLSEDELGKIKIRGWSMSERSVQTFKLSLSGRMRRLALDPGNLSVHAGKNDEGLDGYVFEFNAKPGSAASPDVLKPVNDILLKIVEAARDER